MRVGSPVNRSPSTAAGLSISPTAKEFNITDGEVNLGADVLISDSSFEAATIVIEDDETESKVIYKLDEDYTLDYDDEGNAIFSVIEDGALANKATVSLLISYDSKPKTSFFQNLPTFYHL